jgi:hypothetical protein
MEPEHLLLIFEHSPEESQLEGIDEAIRALRQNDMDVKVVSKSRSADGFIGSVLRFWFPYLSSEGVTGVTPSGALEPTAEVGEFIVTRASIVGPVFGAALGAWLQARHGRKVRVKFDDIEVEAQAPEHVEALLSRLGAVKS